MLRGGMGAKARTAALARLQPEPGQPPLLAVAIGSYIGEGFDCPPWTPCSSPRRSRLKGAWSSMPGGYCAPTPAKPRPKSMTTTTPPPACSPHRWPNAPPDIPASDSLTPAASPTHPVRAQPGKWSTHSLDNQCALAGTRVCGPWNSTAAQPRATRHRIPLMSCRFALSAGVPASRRAAAAAPAPPTARPAGPPTCSPLRWPRGLRIDGLLGR